MRNIQGRPVFSLTTQQWDATPAGDLVGIKSQTVADASTAGTPVTADPQANLYVSLEDTDAFEINAPALDDEGTPFIVRTFKQLGTESVTIIPAPGDTIEGNSAVELGAAGSYAVVMPYQLPDKTYTWLIVSSGGTVVIIP